MNTRSPAGPAEMEPSSFPLFTPGREAELRAAVLGAVDILLRELAPRPYSGATPAALKQRFAAPFVTPGPAPAAVLDAELSEIIRHSIHPGHPLTTAHLHCPVLVPALAAEVILTALNQSMDSFDQAPSATIIEQKVIRWLCDAAGLPTAADGTFTAGGTLSNYTALLLARDHYALKHFNWRTAQKGLPPQARNFRFICSEVAHFSVEKSALQLGLGTDAVVKVPVDAHYRMKPDALERCIAEITASGSHAVAVVATAGTTDFGSIDPLGEIGRIARAAGAWFHVDAAYGGALLFTPQHRAALNGIELADSIGLDFHKLLWMPISCAACLVRDARLFEPIKMLSDYLNPAAHEELGIPDLVTKSVQTTRRFDALKVWLSLRSLGQQQLAAMIDRCLALAQDVARIIAADPAFALLHEPELSCIVFRLRSARGDAADDRINEAVRLAIFNAGEAVLGHTVVGGRNCLKFTLLNPTAVVADYVGLLTTIKRHAARLAAS